MRVAPLLVLPLVLSGLIQGPRVAWAQCMSPMPALFPLTNRVPASPTLYRFEPAWTTPGPLRIDGPHGSVTFTTHEVKAHDGMRVTRIDVEALDGWFTVRGADHEPARRFAVGTVAPAEMIPPWTDAQITWIDDAWTCSHNRGLVIELRAPDAVAFRARWRDGHTEILPPNDRAFWGAAVDPAAARVFLGHPNCVGDLIDPAYQGNRDVQLSVIHSDGTEVPVGQPAVAAGCAAVDDAPAPAPAPAAVAVAVAAPAPAAPRRESSPLPWWIAAAAGIGAAVTVLLVLMMRRRRTAIVLLSVLGVAFLPRLAGAECAMPSPALFPMGDVVPPGPTLYRFEPAWGDASPLRIEGPGGPIAFTATDVSTWKDLRVTAIQVSAARGSFTVHGGDGTVPRRFEIRALDRPRAIPRWTDDDVALVQEAWTCSHSHGLTVAMRSPDPVVAFRVRWRGGHAHLVPPNDRAFWFQTMGGEIDPADLRVFLGHPNCVTDLIDPDLIGRRDFELDAIYADGSELPVGAGPPPQICFTGPAPAAPPAPEAGTPWWLGAAAAGVVGALSSVSLVLLARRRRRRAVAVP